MRAILINSRDKAITEVETDAELADMYELIGCSMVEVVAYRGTDVWVDEEGLLTLSPDTCFFKLEGAPQPYAGNGLILECDNMGETIGTTWDIEELENLVSFHTMADIQAEYLGV